MEKRENQRLVQVALRRSLATDRAKIQVSPLSRFGLVEMTRQRQRPSHKLVASAECPYCVGTGAIKTAETFEIDCMREIRQMLHSRSLTRLEVVVPADLSVGMLNNRRKELASLEERTDCRIVFNPDSLMKAREFRLNPTFRKGERRRDEKHQPVRPSLLAPLMVEQAKAIKLAKELAAMKAEDLERELSADPASGEARDSAAAKAAIYPPRKPGEVVVAAAPAPRKAAEVWEEAAVLRRLLFSANGPVLVAPSAAPAGPAPGHPPLASERAPATNPPRDNHGGRRRRRRR
jgi:ribonuclease E